MSRFKKIFVIISAVICVLVSSFLIATNTIMSNVSIAMGSPYSVVVFDHSLAGDETKEAGEISAIDKHLNNTTKVSIFDKLVNGFTLSKKIHQDSKDRFAKWSTDILNKNLVIEVIYSSMQDLVVYYDGYSRVISYRCLSFVIPNTKNFTEIPVYFSDTQDSNEKNKSYAENPPLVLCGNAEELSKFVKSLRG